MSEWIKIRRDPIALLESLRPMGDVVHFQRGTRSSYLVFHPEYMKEVLVTNHRKYRLNDIWMETKRLLGNGLLHSEGEFHKRQRRMANPAFHHGRVTRYADTMASYAERASSQWTAGAEMDVHKEMIGLTLSVVGKTLFNVDTQGPDAEEFRAAMSAVVPLFRTASPIRGMLENMPIESTRKFDEARAAADAFLYRVIEERRRSGEDHGDLLSLLLMAQDVEGDGGSMTDEQLRDESMTLVAAGHETTANALSWTWYALSQNPDVEAKLHEELDRELGGRLPTFEDLPKLTYTRGVLNEVMRLYPPAWMLLRAAAEETTIGEYTIPEGATVLLFPFMAHRDERWWPEPTKFDPDRWAEGDAASRHKYAYLPFGAGPRMCIGEQFAWMEANVVVAVIAQKWRLRLREGHRVVPEARVNLRPRNGLPMVAERR